MRALTPTLLAAQQAASAEPYLRVRLSDLDVGIPRLRWSRWYSGVEPDGPCAVAVAGDGALLRARIDAATGALHHQHVATPAEASTYSAWTSLGTVHAGARLGIAAAGTRALIATVRTGGLGVEVRESTDAGATFGASSLLTTAVAAVTAIACTLQADGSAVVLYAAGGVVSALQRTGLGGWSMPAAWTRTLAGVSALAAAFEDGDHQVLVSGATSAGATGVWSTIYGAGGAMPPGFWAVLTEVTAASPGTGVTYVATGVASAGASRAAFVEAYAAGGAARLHLASGLQETGFSDQQWREAQPLAVAGAHGAGCAATSGDAWLATPSGVWHAPIDVSITELSADVVEAEVQQSTDRGRAHLVLRNDDGRYRDGAVASLAPGGELRIDPGYRTAAGEEASEDLRFWITSVRRVFRDGGAHVEVDAVDGRGLLEAWTASRQYVWPAGSASAGEALAQAAARVGLRLFNDAASVESVTLQPAMTLRAGERAALLVRRVLDGLADITVTRGAGLALHEPVEADATTYAYGTTHAIRSADVEDSAGDVGRVRVFGRGVFAEAVDADALGGGAGTAVEVDDNLTVQARADARADALLHRASLARPRGVLVVPPNVGQEVGDVVEVTSAPLGLDAARFRVAALRLRFARGGRRPQYEMTLSLSEVV